MRFSTAPPLFKATAWDEEEEDDDEDDDDEDDEDEAVDALVL